MISEEELFEALFNALGIKWKGVEAVTEKTFAMIEKVTLYGDRKLEIEAEEEA